MKDYSRNMDTYLKKMCMYLSIESLQMCMYLSIESLHSYISNIKSILQAS